MSLQVWLPLNGNLNNQGLSDVNSVLVNNPTIDNNGKIGKCYSFNNSYIDLNIKTNDIFSSNNSPFTISSWIYITTLNTSNNCGLFGSNRYYSENINGYKGGGFGFSITSSKDFVMMMGTDTSESMISFNITVEANKWYHLTATYDGTMVKLYINGELKNSQNSSWTTNAQKFYAGLGTQGGWTYITPNKLNDLRIYNHCLSPKEVEEISKGLVLHYKLNDGYAENTTNLVTSISAGGQTTVSNNIVTTSGVNADTYFTINLSESIVEGTTYSVSCDAEGLPDGVAWGFPMGWQNNTSYYFYIYNGHNEYTFTANSGSWGTNRLFMDDNSSGTVRSSGNITKMYNFQVEKKDHCTPFVGYNQSRTSDIIYDSSGYGHNGIINNNSISILSNSPRYNKYFNNPSTTYPIRGSCYMPPSSNLTFSWWMNCSAWGAQTSGLFSTSSDNASDYQTTAANMRDSCFDCCNESGTCIRISVESYITLNEWHHYCLTYDGSNLKFYKDGILKTSTAQTGNLKSFNYIYPFYSKAGGLNRVCVGGLSDFRVYATTLTAAQIKELYDTSASISNNGNLFVREVIEE